MRLLILATGGTIACLPDENGLSPAFAAKDLLDYVSCDCDDIECRDLFSLDSSNIQPEEWQTMAEAVHQCVRDGFDGVVITHGTDTLAYTASMLSFMLQGIPIPVVLTGSQYPIAYPDSDGKANLTNAILAAQSLSGGVYICFGDRIILGCRSVKVRTMSLNAFESINYPNIGTIARRRFIRLHMPPKPENYLFRPDIDPNVALIKLAPGTSPKLFTMLPECGCKGVVIEGFGLGGVHNMRRNHTEAIASLIDRGIAAVLTTQCLYEYSNPNVYEVSSGLAQAGVISAMDMTTEAAVTKLMWVLRRERSLEGIKKLMQRNLCGEISNQ